MNRAIAYILVDGEVGPHAQVADILDERKREIVRKAADLGLSLTGVYADIRREMESQRVGLRTLLSEVQKQNVGAIVVESFDVFADPHSIMIDSFACIKERNAKIYVLNDNRVLDYEHVELIYRALEMARQYDQRLNADRIRRGLKHALLTGRPIGRRPFEHSEANAEIFGNVLEMRERGLSLRDICKALNSAGVKSSALKVWHPTTIKRMLERSENQ